MGREAKANARERERNANIERGALVVAEQARNRMYQKYSEPFVKEWLKRPLDELIKVAETIEYDAYNYACAGFPHALMLGWEVRDTAAVASLLTIQSDASVASVSQGDESYDQHVYDREIVKSGCALALARSFAAIDLIRVAHHQISQAIAPGAKPESEPEPADPTELADEPS